MECKPHPQTHYSKRQVFWVGRVKEKGSPLRWGPTGGGAGSQNAYEGAFKPLTSFLSHAHWEVVKEMKLHQGTQQSKGIPFAIDLQ